MFMSEIRTQKILITVIIEVIGGGEVDEKYPGTIPASIGASHQ